MKRLQEEARARRREQFGEEEEPVYDEKLEGMRQKMLSKIEEIGSDENGGNSQDEDEQADEDEVPPAEVMNHLRPSLADESAPQIRFVAHLSTNGKVFKGKEADEVDFIPVVQPHVLDSILKKPDTELQTSTKILIQELDDDKAEFVENISRAEEIPETQAESEVAIKDATLDESATIGIIPLKPKSKPVATVKVSKGLMQEISLKKAAEDELSIAPAADEPEK